MSRIIRPTMFKRDQVLVVQPKTKHSIIKIGDMFYVAYNVDGGFKVSSISPYSKSLSYLKRQYASWN